MSVTWLTAFLDFAPQEYAAGTAFWSRVTGYGLSPSRGEQDQFATLVPTDGTDFLRVQRLDAGPSRLHLDVHVTDQAAAADHAIGLGARLVDEPWPEVTVVASPGGLTFCLVTEPGGDRPRPASWADGHASYVDQVCLDIPPRLYDAETDFWHRLTGWQRARSTRSEFDRINPPPALPLLLLLQRLDEDEPHVRAHLDWSVTDREIETARHRAAGAEPVARFEEWTVMRDPVGTVYCITGRGPSGRS